VQIGQQSSARSSRPAGLEGALRSSLDGCALASAVAPLTPAPSARDARARMKLRTGTPAQTVPDTNPLSNATGTSPSSSRFTRLTRQNHSAGTSANFSYNITSRQSGRVAIHPVCCQKSTYGNFTCGRYPTWPNQGRGLADPLEDQHVGVALPRVGLAAITARRILI
jgi:hypothetical protein